MERETLLPTSLRRNEVHSSTNRSSPSAWDQTLWYVSLSHDVYFLVPVLLGKAYIWKSTRVLLATHLATVVHQKL